jgi:cytochrome P450
MTLTDEFDAWYTNDPAVIADPYPFFHRLRKEAPIFRRNGLVVLSRHADCSEASINTDLWKTDGKRYDYGSLDPAALPPAQQQQLRELFEMERLGLNKTEGEQHARLRGLVKRAFTPRTVAGMQDRMQQVADELLDRVAPTGHMDAIADFAFQLPIIMICEMLEVPIEDRHQIREWGLGISGLFGGVRDDVLGVIDSAHRNKSALFAYLRKIIEGRRSARGVGSSSVMSILLEAESGDRLSDEELVANAALFVFAGHETTTNAIGNALIALMTHRSQWDILREDLDLAPNAADEALRYLPPVHTEPRYASREVELAGESIGQGERLRLLWAAANRDPERFEDPDRFDVTRSEIKHLAFGVGRHYCLGASLAKQEIATAISTLARRFPDMRMVEAEPRWRPSFNVHGVSELPLVLGADRGRAG